MAEIRPQKKFHIVVADDDESFCFFLKKAGTHLNFPLEMSWVKSGDELLSFLRKAESGENPAIILLDVKMPGRSSEDVLRDIKAEKRFSSTPVIMCSNFPVDEIKTVYTRLGARDCLAKPSGFKDFVAVLEKIISKAEEWSYEKSQQT